MSPTTDIPVLPDVTRRVAPLNSKCREIAEPCETELVGVGVGRTEGAIPSGTVTFLFTDVEGSTRLWSDDSDAMSASLQVHDTIVRSGIESAGGYVFSTAGDSFAAAFDRSSEAVRAIADIQSALGNATWPGPELRIRAGLHLGEAEQRDRDYFGPAVNTAARISASGHGAQTLLSDAVRVAARADGTLDLGMHELRDVEEPVHLHQLGDTEFPELRSKAGDELPGAAVDLPRSWLVISQPGHQPETLELASEMTIGRDVGQPAVAGHLALRDDPTVSRLHAVLIPKPTGWCIQAANATNGLFVNGSRLAPGAVHLLSTEDEVRLGERTNITFRTLGPSTDDRSRTETARPIPDLTPGERRVLLSLCSPVLSGDSFTPPATVQVIAQELFVTESAVKQQLGRLYGKFDVDEGTDRRVRLANEALSCGAVRVADLQTLRDT